MQNSSKVAGILTIVSGAFGVVWLFFALFSALMMKVFLGQGYYYNPRGAQLPPGFENLMAAFYIAWGAFFCLVGIFAVIAGVFTLKKRSWGLGLAGAIAGTVTFFPTGIPAIIYCSLAKPEFSTKKQIAASQHVEGAEEKKAS